MTITGGTALPKDEIDDMVKEAEAHAEEDRKRREEIEIRNNADNLVYQTEKLLSDQAEQVSDDEKSAITEKLDALKKALEGDDIEAVKSSQEELIQASQTFAQRLYEQASAQAGTEAPGAGAPGAEAGASDDDVADAEIVDEEGESGGEEAAG